MRMRTCGEGPAQRRLTNGRTIPGTILARILAWIPRAGFGAIPRVASAMLCSMALATTSYAQVSTTLIQDTVYEASGAAGQGSVILSWPAFSTVSGQSVAAGTTTVTLGSSGSFSTQLAPNAGATPMGTYYTVVYHLGDGTVSREYWVVPVTTSAVTISSIRSTVLPLSVAMQTVSKAYVDNAINSLTASGALSQYVAKAGDTMTGPLVLPGDPTAPNQASDKHYVDVSTAALTAGVAQKVSTLPAGAQTVDQPAGSALGVNDLNGVFYASQYQTGANNNGIANVASGPNCTTGCSVVAEPTYAAVEQASGYSELGTSTPGWPARTHLKDLRGGGEIDSFQDPINPFQSGSLDGHTILYAGTLSADTLKAKYGNTNTLFAAEHIVQSGLTGGNTQETQNGQAAPYGKTTYTGLEVAGVYATEGQHVLNSSSMNCQAVGDCLIAGYSMLSSGGWRDGSDEGAHPGGMKISEDPKVATGVCSGGCSPGSTQVSIGSLSYLMGEGRFLIDKNASGVVSSGTTGCGISSGLQQNYPFSAANFSGSNCFPVSVFFLAAGPVAPQANSMQPGAVTVAIATSGLPAGYSTSTSAAPSTTGVACVADTIPGAFRAESSFETASYTVVDATHLTVTFKKPHGYAPTISMGGMCGYGLESTVDTRGAIRQVVPVMGSISPTSLYYAANNMVGLGIVGGTSSFTSAVSNISSISRSGNVATVVLTNSIADLNGLTATVGGVSDASFDGSFPITTTSGNSFTYANVGANASSSGGTMSFVTGGFNLYPMAEVLGVLNPATNAVDGGNVALAANTVKWAANDPLEEPHFHLMLTQGDGFFSFLSQTTPRPNYGESSGEGLVFGGYNGAGFVGHSLNNTTPASSYYGNGGTLGAPLAAMQVQGTWGNVFDVPAGDSTVLNVHCNSHGCNRWDSGYNLFALQTNAGGGVSTIGFTPASNTLSTTIANWSFGNASMSGIGSMSIGGGAAITSSSNLCQSNGTNCPAAGGGSLPLGTSGQIAVMNAAGTAYAAQSISGDATLAASGALALSSNIPRLSISNTFGAKQTITSAPASGGALSVANTQGSPNAGDTFDGAIVGNYALNANSTTSELVVRGLSFTASNQLTGGGAVSNLRGVDSAITSSPGTTTTNAVGYYAETYPNSSLGTIVNADDFLSDGSLHGGSSTAFHAKDGSGNSGVTNFCAFLYSNAACPGKYLLFSNLALPIAAANSAATFASVAAASYIAAGPSATVAAGSGAGSGATAVCASGYTCLNARGKLTITAGSGAVPGAVAAVTFGSAYGSAPICTVTQNGGTVFLGVGSSGETATTFNVTAAAGISGTLVVNYRCVQ